MNDGGSPLGRAPGLPPELLRLLERHPRESWTRREGLSGLGDLWLGRHAMFRNLHVALTDAAAALGDGRFDPDEAARRIPPTVDLLTAELEGHHHIEDAHYFPRFARAAPELSRGFALLDGDHHALHAALDELGDDRRRLAAGLASGEPARSAADRFAAALERFGAALHPHLDDEEDLVIPLIIERARRDPDFR